MIMTLCVYVCMNYILVYKLNDNTHGRIKKKNILLYEIKQK